MYPRRPATYAASLASRSDLQSSGSANSSSLCFELDGGNIIISKKTLIAALSGCVLLTCVSMLAVAALLYREYARRREAQAAREWDRKTDVKQRISLMRNEVDNHYSRQYSGCLYQEQENPEMSSEGPVELMLDDRISEAPAIPARTANKNKRKSRVSLVFDQAVGMWLPKRR